MMTFKCKSCTKSRNRNHTSSFSNYNHLDINHSQHRSLKVYSSIPFSFSRHFQSIKPSIPTKTAPKWTFLSYRPEYMLNGTKWEFNPYDTDTNPHLSVPHGDDYYPKKHTLKLNVDNGYIYTARNRRCIGKLSQKELQKLKSDPKFIQVKRRAQDFRNGKTTDLPLNSDNYIYRCKLSLKAHPLNPE